MSQATSIGCEGCTNHITGNIDLKDVEDNDLRASFSACSAIIQGFIDMKEGSLTQITTQSYPKVIKSPIVRSIGGHPNSCHSSLK